MKVKKYESWKVGKWKSLGVIFACVLIIAGSGVAVDLSTSGDSQTEPPNIYSSIGLLVDSLKSWADAPAADSSFASSNAGMHIDSLDLAELFPGCIVTEVDSHGTKQIFPPPYMDLLTTVLILNNSDGNQHWTSPVNWDGEHLLVDSIPIPLSGQLPPDEFLVNHIRNRITMLRTTGLPEDLCLQFIEDDTSQVIVTVRGRDIIDIPFNMSSWQKSLTKITAGMQVYAGLLSVKVDFSEAFVKYYMLITSPGIEGHHFLEWREKLSKIDITWLVNEVTIMFSPHIRTDNLKNLFGKPKQDVQEPIELRINR